MNKRIHGFRS